MTAATFPTQPGPVQGSPPPSTRGGFLGLGLFTSRSHRVLAGVAGGLGERLGVRPVFVRLGFVLLCLNGGLGLLAYLVLWALVPEPTGVRAIRAPTPKRAGGLASMLLGTMILLREAGLWFGDAVAWSVGLAALGVAVVWLRSEGAERDRMRQLAGRLPADPVEELAAGRAGRIRLVIGALLVAAGIATFLLRTNVLNSAPAVVLAVATTLLGLGIFAGPWAWRTMRQLSDERRERIRQEERAEMAAHLHDSVLQTLALIQRTDRPKEMVALARGQERELRAWLNGTALLGEDRVARAIERMAASVELQFKVAVEVVTVGDTILDDRTRSLIDAAREATVNAARHSGSDLVSVYVEVEPHAITAYVRDEGEGFDTAEVSSDRRGIAESIRGRMERAGGAATVHSSPGEGTEVQLTLSRPGS